MTSDNKETFESVFDKLSRCKFTTDKIILLKKLKQLRDKEIKEPKFIRENDDKVYKEMLKIDKQQQDKIEELQSFIKTRDNIIEAQNEQTRKLSEKISELQAKNENLKSVNEYLKNRLK